MRKIVLASGVFALAASTSLVNGGVEIIDFDDIDLGGATRNNFPALGIENTYRGYMWPSNGDGHWAAVNNADNQFSTVGAWSGEQAGWNWNGPASLDIIFDVEKDVQGAYFNVFMAGQDWGADGVWMEGFDEFNQSVGQTGQIALDDVSNNPQWVWLQADLQGVKTLRIHTVQGDPNWGTSGWWTIDDLTLGPIPAPGAMGLLVLGALGARRRRG